MVNKNDIRSLVIIAIIWVLFVVIPINREITTDNTPTSEHRPGDYLELTRDELGQIPVGAMNIRKYETSEGEIKIEFDVVRYNSAIVQEKPYLAPTPTPVPVVFNDYIFDIDRGAGIILYKKGDCIITAMIDTNTNEESGICTGNDWDNFRKEFKKIKPIVDTPIPTPKPTLEPVTTPSSSKQTKRWTISELDSVLKRLKINGWNTLYEKNEFDCSRMSSYWLIIFERDYGIESQILVSNVRNHAWVAVRVSDFESEPGSTYITWTDSDGVKWYYIEPTIPEVVKYDSVMDGKKAINYYYVVDTQTFETYDAVVKYSRKEFELTNDDTQKVNDFYGRV